MKYPAQEMYDGGFGSTGDYIEWPPRPKWQVWYAWFPVAVETTEALIHDEIVVTYKYRWLCNVARRKNWQLVHGGGTRWEYAPAHKAVTQ